MDTCNLISPDFYNALPDQDSTTLAATLKTKEHQLLKDLITAYGLGGKLSVCLLHKQPLDVPKDRIVVHRATPEGDVLCNTQYPPECKNLRGYRFRSTAGGIMSAYEFTTEPVIDLSLYVDFTFIFSRLLHDLRVQNIFGLVADGGWEKEFCDPRGLLKFGFIYIFCPWPPSVGEYPDYDDWAYRVSVKASVGPAELPACPSPV